MKRSLEKMPRRQFLRTAPLAAGLASTFPGVIAGAGQAGSGDRIKIGQIGTQHAHAVGKMQSIRKLRDLYEVVGVVEPDAAARAKAERSVAFRDLPFINEEQLFNTPGLQAVAVETLVPQLVPTGMRCLEAGLHIHLDKPAGETMSACRALHALAAQQRRTVQMGYMFRYNAGFEFLFQALADGWLGEVTEVSGMIGKLASDSLRDDLSQYTGGGMFELACHLIDALVTVLGKPGSVHSFVRRSRLERDTFADNQLAVFEYPRALATLRCNHRDPFGFPRRQFNVTGTQGTVEIRPLEAPRVRLLVDRDRGEYEKGVQDVRLEPMTGRYDGEFRDLAKVIRGEKALAWDAKHDLAVHETVLHAGGMPVD